MNIDTKSAAYQNHLREEAGLWDKTARDELKDGPPDYAYYRNTLPYRIYRHPYVQHMLDYIKPGDRVLELGCYNGWFSLEMARRGAQVDAHDIAKKAIRIAQHYYKCTKAKEKVIGTVSYHVTDLNAASFPPRTYDAVVIRNVLHHIMTLRELFEEVRKSMKPRGKLLVDDALPCGKKEAIFTGMLLMLLPTDIPYHQKIWRVFRKGNIIQRTQGLVDAKGASPFESISGEESIACLRRIFDVKHCATFAVFVGTVAAHVRLSPILRTPLLRLLNVADRVLTKVGILRGTSYFLIARNAC